MKLHVKTKKALEWWLGAVDAHHLIYNNIDTRAKLSKTMCSKHLDGLPSMEYQANSATHPAIHAWSDKEA